MELTLADRLDLYEIPGRYGDAIDDRNWENLRRIFTPDAVDSRDPAVGLAAVATLRTLVEELEVLHVDNARSQGWTWQAIAEQLGITRQSAHKKHRRSR